MTPAVLAVPEMGVLTVKRTPPGILDVHRLGRGMRRTQRISRAAQPDLVGAAIALPQLDAGAITAAAARNINAAIGIGLTVNAALRVLPPFLAVSAMTTPVMHRRAVG